MKLYAVADKDGPRRDHVWVCDHWSFLSIVDGGGKTDVTQLSLTHSHILRDFWREQNIGTKVNMTMTLQCLLSGDVTCRCGDTAAIWRHVYWSVASKVQWLTPSHEQLIRVQCTICRPLQRHLSPRQDQSISQSAFTAKCDIIWLPHWHYSVTLLLYATAAVAAKTITLAHRACRKR